VTRPIVGKSTDANQPIAPCKTSNLKGGHVDNRLLTLGITHPATFSGTMLDALPSTSAVMCSAQRSASWRLPRS
jgi:hypothetical protein